jgi:hypothetical protein
MRLILPAATAVALSACSTANQPPQVTAAQDVYALRGTFDAALKTANAYAALPACTATGSPVCSDGTAVLKLQAIADAASASLSAAEASVRNPAAFDDATARQLTLASQQAVAELAAVASSLKVN